MKVTRIAAAVLAALALPVSTAGAADGKYTYMLCSNPDTGFGTTTTDGTFPDGVTMNAGHLNMTTLQGAQRCSGTMAPDRGLIIKPQGAYTLAQQQGTTFTFTAPPEVTFVDAKVWRRSVNFSGMMTAFVRSASDWIYAGPNYGRCQDPGFGCLSTGNPAPYHSLNQVSIGEAHDGMPNGFKWFLRCSAPSCSVSNQVDMVVFGGKVNLVDNQSPTATIGVGGLRGDDVLRGVERVSFSARDGQTGMYRGRLLVDGVAQPWFSLDGGNASCRDVNPRNADDYEFGRMRPCAAAIDAVAELNTTKLKEGAHNVRLVVEDASGRSARLLDRDVAVDNIAPPAATVAPRVEGLAKDGEALTAVPAVWDDGGAEGDPVVTSRWERCSESCVELPRSATTPLVLDEADVGKRIRLVETAVNSEGTTVARSSFTEVVADTPAPTSVAVASVSGSPRRGNLLVVSEGAWDDHEAASELDVSVQWQRCRWTGEECVDVAGAVGPTYELRDADLNRRLRVVETASNDEGSAVASSAPTARVTREDGTLPVDNNGVDDDGDGTVDEPGETGGGSGGSGGGTGTSGANGTPGAPGADGRNGLTSSSVTSTSTSSRTVRSTLVNPNGTNASLSARLTVGWRDARGVMLKVGYGKGAVAEGRLVDEAGRGIGGAAVHVSAVTSMRGAVPSDRAPVVTADDGRFSYVVPRRAPSETIRFAYAPERGGTPVVIDELELRVIAAVKLAVKLRGVAVSYRGTVISGPMPRGGKLVILQGRVKGKAWQTFASRRARTGGRFSGKYRLKLRVPGRKLQFRARVVAESGFPYLAGVSRAVTRTVR